MWLMILEGTFGFLFVLFMVTQLIWPLLTDTPLFPLFHPRKRSERSPRPHRLSHPEKPVDGEILDRKKPSGDKS
ncbi:MAG: hypothetical protein EPN21_05560 [Methylococcaceae bacterium]|nr:MAG: hypothetical protein EPN21_05560 [Methylococcaceae bacterium]